MMDRRALGRWGPPLAVAVLLVAGALAAALSSPGVTRVPLPTARAERSAAGGAAAVGAPPPGPAAASLAAARATRQPTWWPGYSRRIRSAGRYWTSSRACTGRRGTPRTWLTSGCVPRPRDRSVTCVPNWPYRWPDDTGTGGTGQHRRVAGR